jgi:hypothetical protein
MEGKPILFRDYQVSVVNNFLANPQSLQEAATGAGKCLHPNTEIEIEIDENSDFYKFLINKI